MKDAIAPLIPWYVNGSLERESRRSIEAHLEGCPDCRALLAHARAVREMGPEGGAERLRDHVQAQLLTEFVESPGSLESETRAWILSHQESCDSCRELDAILRGLRDQPFPERREANDVAAGGSPMRALWRALAGSILRPVPALVYLIALLIVYPASRLVLVPAPAREPGGAASPGSVVGDRPSGRVETEGPSSAGTTGPSRGPGISQSDEVAAGRGSPAELSAALGPAGASVKILPRAVVLYGREDVRGLPPDSGTPGEAGPPAPVAIEAPGSGMLLLELRTGIDPEVLADARAGLEIEVRDSGGTVVKETRKGRDFDRGGVLRVLLESAILDPGRTQDLTIRLQRTGDPLDGQVLFRTSFQLSR